MYKSILFFSLLHLAPSYCDLNMEEGAACEWEGVNGTCVNSHRCFTALDNKSPKQPVCTQQSEESIICCTDCDLVNDTRNIVITPTAGFFWKNGQKAWDKCLEYVGELPYDCRLTFYSGIQRALDVEKNCHVHYEWGIGGATPPGWVPVNKYPHTVLLGFGDDLESAKWLCGGSIISNTFILTAAHCIETPIVGAVKYVAYGVIDRTKPANEWKHVEVNRTIQHPEYKPPNKYHDIGLIETLTPIHFENGVLPACLHVIDAADDTAKVTAWSNIDETDQAPSNTLNEIVKKKYGKTECSEERVGLKRIFNETTQLCYGDRDQSTKTCKGISGATLFISTQISWCADTIIGVTSLGKDCRASRGYNVYTRVSHYVPWIESVVWP